MNDSKVESARHPLFAYFVGDKGFVSKEQASAWAEHTGGTVTDVPPVRVPVAGGATPNTPRAEATDGGFGLTQVLISWCFITIALFVTVWWVGSVQQERHHACGHWSMQRQVRAYGKQFHIPPKDVTPRVLAALKKVRPCEDLAS